MTMKKSELPLQVFVNKAAVGKKTDALENLVEVIGEFANELETDGVTLDDDLLNQFVQDGTPAIVRRLVETAEGPGSFMLVNELSAGARRTANSEKYEKLYRKIQQRILKAGRPHTDVVILNGRPSVRGNILEEIQKRHTVTLDSENDVEFYEKLTDFVKKFNDLHQYIKDNRPGALPLIKQMNYLIFKYHNHKGDEILTSGHYIISKLSENREDIEVIVNPLYFKRR